jgi:hypothetical protein
MSFFAECVEQHAIELCFQSRQRTFIYLLPIGSVIVMLTNMVKIITFEEAFEHCDTGVGLCLLLPRAYVLRKFVDLCIERDISVHFVFACPISACEFEAAAWLHNLLQDRVQHIGFLQNLGLTFCPKSNQEKLLIACQVEPNAEQCLIGAKLWSMFSSANCTEL